MTTFLEVLVPLFLSLPTATARSAPHLR
ncbi:hypothetical protein JMJ77_0007700 [Colletotrichum scovillei]|uniref:Uncharacterized protein n=1 Tax=Colletotrichum scovillei TaxID=1209932 RepID=A0A9P7RDH3_9PEZI|nr:hypothetical protein JMJ77_0007700 [Colletotrichum scovillei]KAG7074680.1 hypothetical protein JMJ76_0011154 [Colletotrichum scovillei]KAG7081918.1 hypothetical protein JMJ78_0004029 [Colletotrichum scovillei]